MTDAIRAEGLTKRFGTTQALDGVDLTAAGGTVLGVLGPNGAGKTTAVRVLATLLTPDSGRAEVCGHDVLRQGHAVRQLIGLTGQYASVDEQLTGSENLVMIGRLLGLSRRDARARAAELLERFGLTEAAGRAAGTYSGGMRRRIDLAASLVRAPRVLFLDEPTTGLDPHARNEVWDIIRGLTGGGATVLLTTQYMDEADQLADRIAVFDHGRVIADGTPEQLKTRAGRQTLVVRPTDRARTGQVAAAVAALVGAQPAVDAGAGVVTVTVADSGVMSGVVRRMDDDGIALTELSLRLPSLDEVFLSLTGRRAEATLDGAAAELADLERSALAERTPA